MSDDVSHFLYVIAAEGQDDVVKLGFAADPARRLRDLQTGASQKLVLHHAEPVSAEHVRQFERMLHRDMHHLRQRGEWFRMPVVEAVRQVMFTVIRYEEELENAAFWRR